MRRLLWLLPLLLFASARPASAQLANAQGWCESGATVVVTSGLQSTNQVQGSFPSCTISVSIHGGGTATIYSTGASTPLSNPFTAQTNGRWIFYAANGEYDITMTGGGLTSPVTYSDVFIGTGGGGGGGTPGGSNTQVQYNNAGAFGGANGVVTDATSLDIKGPRPFVDVTNFGARAVVTIPQATATTIATSPNVTLSSASTFQNGDGITLYNAGATVTMSTPGAPTVTPSEAIAGTGTGLVTNSGTGASTYSYCVIARDTVGGLTPCSSTTTIANGQSTLGLTTATISTMSRSNDVVTVDTSSSNLMAAGAMVHIYGSSNPDFTGWYSVDGVNSSTEFVLKHTPIDSRGLGSLADDSTSAAGGTASIYLSNHISWTAVTGAWEYYICAERPGDSSFKLIGVTKPSADTWVENTFDDFGSPYMDNQTFPAYVTNSSCTGSGLNDPLTTTISSGAGTTSIVLATNAINSSSGQTAIYDAAPNVNAAISYAHSNGSNGPIYFPPVATGASYPFESFLNVSAGISWFVDGPINLYETLEFSASSINIFGHWAAGSTPQFGYFGTSGFNIQTANPGIYAKSATYFNHVQFTGSPINGGTNIIYQNMVNSSMEYVSSVTGAGGNAADRLGMAFIGRSTSGGGNSYYFNHVLFRSGPDQVTDKSWTPMVWFPRNQNGSGGLLQAENNLIHCVGCWAGIRGYEEDLSAGSAGYWTFDAGNYRQAGITPFILISNNNGSVGGFIHIFSLLQDTESVGTLAFLDQNAGGFDISVSTDSLINASADTNGTPPPFSGYRTGTHNQSASNTGKLSTRGSLEVDSASCIYEAPYESASLAGSSTCSPTQIVTAFTPLHFPGGQSEWWDNTIPASLSASLTAGGSLSTSTTFQFIVAGIGIDGGETTPSAIPSSGLTPTLGNQTISLTFTGQPWFTSYNVYYCTSSCTNANGTWNTSATWRWIKNGTTSPISISTLASGNSPSQFSATGSTVFNKSYVSALMLQAPETTAPTGIALFDQFYADSTAHRWKMQNNNGTADTVLGAATTDTLTNKTINPITTTETTAPSAVGGADVCYGDSTAHWLKCAFNAGSFDKMVTETGTETLTNKTLTTPTISSGATLTGTTAGFMDYAQGSTSAAVTQCATANSICEQAPTAVTSYVVTKPGSAYSGITTNNTSAGVTTQGGSGDANHSVTANLNSGTSIGATTLCTSGNCPAGTYDVHVYVDVTTACGSTGTYIVNLTYTDDQGSKTVPVNIQGTGTTPATGSLALSSTSNFGQAVQVIRVASGTTQYSTTAGACGSGGPAVGKIYLAMNPIM